MDTLTAELRAEMKVSASLSVYRSDAKRDPLLAAVKSKAPTWAPPQGQNFFLKFLPPSSPAGAGHQWWITTSSGRCGQKVLHSPPLPSKMPLAVTRWTNRWIDTLVIAGGLYTEFSFDKSEKKNDLEHPQAPRFFHQGTQGNKLGAN